MMKNQSVSSNKYFKIQRGISKFICPNLTQSHHYINRGGLCGTAVVALSPFAKRGTPRYVDKQLGLYPSQSDLLEKKSAKIPPTQIL